MLPACLACCGVSDGSLLSLPYVMPGGHSEDGALVTNVFGCCDDACAVECAYWVCWRMSACVYVHLLSSAEDA